MTRKLPLPQAGSNTRMRAMRLRRFSSLILLSPASSSLRAQVVEEQRVQHLQDVGHAGVVHAQRAALFVVGHRLDHAAEDVGVDLLPVQLPGVEQVGARHAGEARHVGAAGEQPAVDIGKLVGPARQLGLGGAVGVFDVHGAEDFAAPHGVAPSRSLICSTVRVNRASPLKMSVSSAKKQKISRAMKWFMSARRSLRGPVRVFAQQLDVQLVQAPVARTSMGLSLISLTVEMPASGRKKPKWSGKSGSRRRWFRHRSGLRPPASGRRWPG
jgi:hypothetical protein